MSNSGRKDDQGKLPYHLLPSDAVEEILRVLDFGAKKYAPRNWENGMAWSRPFSALMRHMWAWWRGEKADPETGISHLAHAGCCILFLLSYEIRKGGEDDRPSADRDAEADEAREHPDAPDGRRATPRNAWSPFGVDGYL